MRRIVRLATLMLAGLGLVWPASEPFASEPVRVARDGTVMVAGRAVRCDGAQTVIDRSFPNLGAAVMDERVLILNPTLLRRYAGAVQLFVFHHECGHTRIGGSEFGADCWAVKRGVRDGWLDAAGLAQVCRSFGSEPESATHPSGRRRCTNLDTCFAAAMAEQANHRGRQDSTVASGDPQLIEAQRLLWSSRLR